MGPGCWPWELCPPWQCVGPHLGDTGRLCGTGLTFSLVNCHVHACPDSSVQVTLAEVFTLEHFGLPSSPLYPFPTTAGGWMGGVSPTSGTELPSAFSRVLY